MFWLVKGIIDAMSYWAKGTPERPGSRSQGVNKFSPG
jgi:hypothetical protein